MHDEEPFVKLLGLWIICLWSAVDVIRFNVTLAVLFLSVEHHFGSFAMKSATRIEHHGWKLLILLRRKLKSERTFSRSFKQVNLFQPSVEFHVKAVTWFAVQIKWLVSIWNATLGWIGLKTFFFGSCNFRH